MKGFGFLIIGLLGISLWSCQSNGEAAGGAPYREIRGSTMGTYYRIVLEDTANQVKKKVLDSLLLSLNEQVSTYMEQATISIFNRSPKGIRLDTAGPPSAVSVANIHFRKNWSLAQAVYERTNGAFDPTVMPLVNYWGFGYEGEPLTTVDSNIVDSLMQFVGLTKVRLAGNYMKKSAPGVQVDFSGVAKGYGVDLLGEHLEQQGIANYLIDIGGEVRTRGRNAKGNTWQIGISLPDARAGLNEIQTALPLQEGGLATSGNYRNFYKVNGITYSHTINPATGFPERSDLLSASVFASDCATADAYATAFMVLGAERARELAEQLPDIEAYFIVRRDAQRMYVRYTSGLDFVLNTTTLQ